MRHNGRDILRSGGNKYLAEWGALHVTRTQWDAALPDTPERALMRAILEDALRTYLRRDKESHAGREAEAWLESRNRRWLYSFESICEVLGYAPDFIRHQAFRRGPGRMHGVTRAAGRSRWRINAYMRRG